MQLYFQQWTILKRNRKKFYLQVNYFTRCIFLLRYYTVTVGFVVVCLSWLGFPWKQSSDKQVQASYLGSNSRNQEWGRKESEGKKERRQEGNTGWWAPSRLLLGCQFGEDEIPKIEHRVTLQVCLARRWVVGFLSSLHPPLGQATGARNTFLFWPVPLGEG